MLRLNHRGAAISALPGAHMPSIPIYSCVESQMPMLQRHMKMSAYSALADLWIQYFTYNMDKRSDQALLMFFDDMIPKPNAASALFWLMVCESWPLAHPDFDDEDCDLSIRFPPQPMVIPQSTGKYYSNIQPSSALSFGRVDPDLWPTIMLRDRFKTKLTVADREKIAHTLQYNSSQVHRPQVRHYTWAYAWITLDKDIRLHNQWASEFSWPQHPVYLYDGGICNIDHADLHIVRDLRTKAMRDIITYPGLPTHYNNLYDCPGGWIREWSDQGLLVANTSGMENWLPWTPKDDTVLTHLPTLKEMPRVPPSLNAIWFGWSNYGPDVNKITTARTPSELWIDAYLKYRDLAIECLFYPERVNLSEHVDEQIRHRGKVLDKLGRLKTSKHISKQALDADLAEFGKQVKGAVK